MSSRKSSDRMFLLLVVIVGALLRLDFLFASHFVIDADEAIVGLMARHMLEGADIPTFYYGQSYMGSFEPLMAAALMKLTGTDLYALKAVPLLWSLLLIYLVYLLGVQVQDRMAGRVAALLCALGPATLVVWSSKARGGFIELACIGALALLVTLNWLKEPGIFKTFVIGMLLGFGWWVNNQIIYFMLPIGFLMLGRIGLRPFGNFIFRGGAHLFTGLLAFLIGGFPFWLFNWNNQFISFEMFTRASSVDVFAHIQGAFSLALPILFGSIRFWQTQDVFLGATPLIAGVLLICLMLILRSRRSEILQTLTFRATERNQVELLLLFVFATLSVFCLSSFGYLSKAPRYLIPLYVAYFPLIGFSFVLIRKYSNIAANIVLFLVLAVQVSSCYLNGRSIPGQPFVNERDRVSKDHSELIQWLRENNVSVVNTNYWIGYRLAFETQEKVTFVMIHEPFQVRIPEYQEAEHVPLEEKVFVLVPSQAKIYRRALRALGVSYRHKKLSGYQVLYHFTRVFGSDPGPAIQDVLPSASSNNEAVSLAIDSSEETRWSSAKPQSAGMTFSLSLNPPQQVSTIYYSMGPWWHDYPRALEVVLVDSNDEEHLMLTADQHEAIRYFKDRHDHWYLHFPTVETREVVFRQNGSHPIFDWSIAEVRLFRD